MESGFVYIFSNDAFSKNLLKVGMTRLTAKQRAAQISKHEGVSKEYKVIWTREVPNIALAEKALHYFLHKYAYNKEFFLLTPELAILTCSEAIDRIFKPLDEPHLKQEAARLKNLKKKALALRVKLSLNDNKDEIDNYSEEETAKIRIVPVGVEETNWESISDSLSYSFGKEAIRLILKEKKKGDPLRKRFICYRTDYWWCDAIHIFFTKRHISVYFKTNRSESVKRILAKRFEDLEKLSLNTVADGLSLRIKTIQDFKVLKNFLQMGSTSIMKMPLRHK